MQQFLRVVYVTDDTELLKMLVQTLEKMFEARSQRVEAAKTVQGNSVLSLALWQAERYCLRVFFFFARECVTKVFRDFTEGVTNVLNDWKL